MKRSINTFERNSKRRCSDITTENSQESPSEVIRDEDDSMLFQAPSESCNKSLELNTEKIKYSNYFEFIEETGQKYGVCKLCKVKDKQIKIKRRQLNTSGLKRHLITSHGEETEIKTKLKQNIGNPKLDSKQKKITESFEVSKFKFMLISFLEF